MIKVLLIDADGVTIKNHEYFSTRYERDFGKTLNDNVITNFFRNEYKEAAVGKKDLKELLKKRLDLWGWEGTLEELLKYWFEGERELDKELLEIVEKLRKQNITCCLVSDNEKYRADYLLKEVGIGKYFDSTFFSCFIGYTKSEVEFFKKVIKTLNVNPEEILYFDDDQKNLEVAKKLGIKTKIYKSPNQLRKAFSMLAK